MRARPRLRSLNVRAHGNARARVGTRKTLALGDGSRPRRGRFSLIDPAASARTIAVRCAHDGVPTRRHDSDSGAGRLDPAPASRSCIALASDVLSWLSTRAGRAPARPRPAHQRVDVREELRQLVTVEVRDLGGASEGWLAPRPGLFVSGPIGSAYAGTVTTAGRPARIVKRGISAVTSPARSRSS